MVNKSTVLVLILLLSIVGVSANCLDQEYYLLNLRYENGNIKLLSSSLEKGCATTRDFLGEYKVEVEDDNGVIFSSNFNPNNIYTDVISGGLIEGGVLRVNNKDFSLNVPYFKEFSDIKIYKGEEQLSIITREELEKDNNREIGYFGYIDNLFRVTIARFF